MHRPSAILALALLLPLAAGQAPAPDPIDAAIKGLASDSFQIREAAQRTLLAVPVDKVPRVRELAAQVTDPESLERLRTILASLETIEVTTTPGITLNVRDATLEQVAAAMSKSAGITIDADGGDARFTLAAENRPLWDIIDQLSRQHPLGIADRANLTLRPASGTSTRRRQFNRGVLFSISEPNAGGFAGALRLRAWASNVDVVVAVDPRINLFSAHPPILTSVKDNQGRELRLPDEEAAGRQVISDPPHIWSREIGLGIPGELGDRVTIAGSVKFAAIVAEKSIDVPDPAAKLNQAISVGGTIFTLRQVFAPAAAKADASVRSLAFKFEIKPAGAAGLPPEVDDIAPAEGGYVRVPSFGKRSAFPVKGVASGRVDLGNDFFAIFDGVVRYEAAAGGGGRAAAPLDLVATDATGRRVLSVTLSVTAPCTVIAATQTEYKDPVRLTLRTGGIREATVPFEYKDVPLAK